MVAGFGVVLCWVSIGFGVTAGVTMDDSFIVFRVLENWLSGLGPRFNAGDSHFIITSPLWLVVLAAFKAALPSVATPELAQALVWILLVAASVLLFALLKDDFPVASMLAPAVRWSRGWRYWSVTIAIIRTAWRSLRACSIWPEVRVLCWRGLSAATTRFARDSTGGSSAARSEGCCLVWAFLCCV
jgi:hypothetical protein